MTQLPAGPPVWLGYTRQTMVEKLTRRLAWRKSWRPWRRHAAARACRVLVEIYEAAL